MTIMAKVSHKVPAKEIRLYIIQQALVIALSSQQK